MMKLFQDLYELSENKKLRIGLNEKWGDSSWSRDIHILAASIEKRGAESEDFDVDLLKDILNDEANLRKASGATMFKLLDMLMSVKPTIKVTSWGEDGWPECNKVIAHFVRAAIEGGDAEVDALLKHVSILDLQHKIDHNLFMTLKLLATKRERTPEEIKFDDDNDVFIFIARDKFLEEPKGSGKYRKTLDIENLYKIDRFDISDHQALKMMKMRASTQGDGSATYQVSLPKDTMPEKANTNLPDWLVSLIDEHKRRV